MLTVRYEKPVGLLCRGKGDQRVIRKGEIQHPY